MKNLAAFCICKNKGVDQLHGNRAADQHSVADRSYACLPGTL